MASANHIWRSRHNYFALTVMLVFVLFVWNKGSIKIIKWSLILSLKKLKSYIERVYNKNL